MRAHIGASEGSCLREARPSSPRDYGGARFPGPLGV